MEEFIKKIAKAIVHYAYRNTKIEDYHAENVVMDMELYKDIYKMVHQKMGNVQRYTHYILEFARREREGKSLGAKEFELVKEEDRLGFVRYYKEIQFSTLFGTNWDEPELVDVKIGGTLARFVLDGEFKRACINGDNLDDKIMEKINKDIYNRIYSIVKSGLLNI